MSPEKCCAMPDCKETRAGQRSARDIQQVKQRRPPPASRKELFVWHSTACTSSYRMFHQEKEAFRLAQYRIYIKFSNGIFCLAGLVPSAVDQNFASTTQKSGKRAVGRRKNTAEKSTLRNAAENFGKVIEKHASTPAISISTRTTQTDRAHTQNVPREKCRRASQSPEPGSSRRAPNRSLGGHTARCPRLFPGHGREQ